MPIPTAFNRVNQNIRNRASRMTRKQKLSAAGVAVVGASVLAVSVVPSAVEAAGPSKPPAVADVGKTVGSPSPTAAPSASQQARTELAKKLLAANRHATLESRAKAAEAKKAEVAAKAATAKRAARAAAARRHEAVAAVHRTAPQPVHHAAPRPAQPPVRTVAKTAPEYPNNLDGWIRQALAIMKQHDIPGSYAGIHRNIIRESSGNPNAINLWDINAQNGIPSKGLLQVIPPTFAEYHVAGTSNNIYDPVANIVAACNYAAHRYGSMDNVNSAY
jgi:hypothetical protein